MSFWRIPKACIVLWFIGISAVSHAQSPWVLKGHVVDTDNTPLQFVNVYINNTTIGTTTDAKGNFTLSVPDKVYKVQLIASLVGYKALQKEIAFDPDNNPIHLFQLQGAVLQEVKITAEQDKEWKKKWKAFENGLLGESPFRNQCRILNPEVIRLEYVGKTKKIAATATQPILIQNDALGLRISFHMEFFETDINATFFSGFKFFEQLDPPSDKVAGAWKNNQQIAYDDSFRNFLVALTQRKLAENSFEVFRMKVVKDMYYGKSSVAKELSDGALETCNIEEVCMYDADNDQFVLHSELPLLVFIKSKFNYTPIFSDYPYKYSQIVLPRLYVVFTKSGWVTSSNGMIIRDYWGQEGFANYLPDDYAPMLETAGASSESKPIEHKPTLRPQKVDYQAPFNLPPATQEVVLDKRKIQVADNEHLSIVKPDYTVKLSESDYDRGIFDALRKLPGVRVDCPLGDPNACTVRMISNMTPTGGNSSPALLLDGVLYTTNIEDILNGIIMRSVAEIGFVKYGNGAAFGAKGANGTIIITTRKE
ncbi:MAG: carboxypeptidase-like regulatory domain-containing protein [Spirosomataceae bacterium]